MSLLINIAAVGVCSFAISPHLGTSNQPLDLRAKNSLLSKHAGQITRMYPTSLTPKPSLIGTYIAAVYIMQVGYCVILVLARKTETKVSFPPSYNFNTGLTRMQQALIKGTGISLVLANWVMGFWAIAWARLPLFFYHLPP